MTSGDPESRTGSHPGLRDGLACGDITSKKIKIFEKIVLFLNTILGRHLQIPPDSRLTMIPESNLVSGHRLYLAKPNSTRHSGSIGERILKNGQLCEVIWSVEVLLRFRVLKPFERKSNGFAPLRGPWVRNRGSPFDVPVIFFWVSSFPRF